MEMETQSGKAPKVVKLVLEWAFPFADWDRGREGGV